MIVAVYGIPRSGKDTFITEVVKKCNGYHVKGSEFLNRISINKYGNKFRQLDNREQNEVRILFTHEVKKMQEKYDLVIVDGHYSFPSNDKYTSVFTKEDLDLYDAFFYLKRTGEEIIRNFYSGNKSDYSEYLLSPERVEDWISFEINNMKEIVENNDKDFIVLDSDPYAIDFVANFKITSKEIATLIVNNILKRSYNKVILTDLDKTISINDLTNDFIEYSNLDPHFPKTIFKGDYYTRYQFSRFHNYLLTSQNYSESINYALNKLELNNYLINDLKKIKNEWLIIALTTGMIDAWSLFNKEHELFDQIYGFNREVIITPLVKKLVSKYLKNSVTTIAIGDSIIDLGMINEADKGFLVSMQKLDKRIIYYHNEKPLSNCIKQLPYSNYKYDFIQEGDLDDKSIK